MTSDLIQRIAAHKQGKTEGFTKKYGVKMLVYFETCDEIAGAILREKTIKHYGRKEKLALIESQNPEWNDLYDALL